MQTTSAFRLFGEFLSHFRNALFSEINIIHSGPCWNIRDGFHFRQNIVTRMFGVELNEYSVPTTMTTTSVLCATSSLLFFIIFSISETTKCVCFQFQNFVHLRSVIALCECVFDYQTRATGEQRGWWKNRDHFPPRLQWILSLRFAVLPQHQARFIFVPINNSQSTESHRLRPNKQMTTDN